MQTRYFERPEGTLAYSDYGGDGELVLMLPGLGALRDEYRFLAPKLTEAGYHPVSVDLRGHGESSVPWDSYNVPSLGNDILAMIAHLESGAAHVIGTSKAAGGAVWAAVERPEQVRSLVLIGPFARQVKINPLMNALFWIMMNNPWRVQAWAAYYRSIYPSRKPADFEDYLDRLKENLKEPGRFKAAMELSSASNLPSEERLDQIKASTLVIMGTKDPDFPDPVAEAKALAGQTNGELELVEGAGHYPQTEVPEVTVPIVIDFLKRASS